MTVAGAQALARLIKENRELKEEMERIVAESLARAQDDIRFGRAEGLREARAAVLGVLPLFWGYQAEKAIDDLGATP